jgi:surfeit locus 1 family protein
MLRNALRPRWLSLLGLVVVVCVGFGWLGAWQLGAARDRGGERARRAVAARPVVPIGQVLRPQQPFGVVADTRSVTASGRYDPGRQVLVSGRTQGGRVGWWVVAALRTSGGGWLPVVRGWVPAVDDERGRAAGAPSGVVRVAGVLQPDEPAADPGAPGVSGASSPGAGANLTALDSAELVNRWGGPIYNGYLVLSAESVEPGASTGTGPGPSPGTKPGIIAAQPDRVPLPQPQAAGLAWRNAAYAVQWWVFAGFAVVLWWKMVRQDLVERQSERAQPDE